MPAAGADAIDHLTLRWTELDTGKGATASITAAEVAANGTWNVGVLPVSQQLQLQVYGCTVDNRAVWYGKGSDFAVKQGEDTTAQIFLTQPGKLDCVGRAGSGGSLQTSRAFAGGATLASGNAIIAGGAASLDGKSATASPATDIYDYRLGQWRPGPPLHAARIWPQVLPLDRTHVLVVGGVPHLAQTQTSLPIVLFSPDDVSKSAQPTPVAEVIDIQTDPTTAVAIGANFGSGALPLSRATVAGDGVVFIGGLDQTGQGVTTGARVRGLAGIASGTGTLEPLTLATARVQPAVLSYADGTVVVWGGQSTGNAANFGEIIAPGSASGARLQVSGAPILADPNAQTLGAAAVVLSEQADILTFFVTGGIPANTGWATDTPSYVVAVDRKQGTAACTRVSLPGGAPLPGGLGIAATRLDGGYILLSGGLLSLGKLAAAADPQGLCQTDDQVKHGCVVSGFTLLQPIIDPLATTVTPVVFDTLSPLGPHFGQVALPLPVGALLAGGMMSVSMPASATDTFDSAAQIVTAPLSLADGQAACAL